MDNNSKNTMDKMKEKVEDEARIAKSQAQLTGDKATAKAHEVKNDIKEKSEHAWNVTKEKATEASHTAQEKMQQAKHRIEEKFD